MATVRDLKTSITRMSYEDALKVIISCRNSRREVKKPIKRKGKSAPKQKRVIDPFAVVRGMTDEQKAALRRELLGE